MRHPALVLLVACLGCASSASLRSAPPPDTETPPSTPAGATEKLVLTGTVEVTADDVDGLVRGVRARIAAAGGRVLNEQVAAASRDAPRALLRVRLPPAEVTPFVDWLATRALVTSRRLEAQDVSRSYLDQELALRTLRVTMARLEKLGERGGELKDVLAIEKELTRVRGEIEQIEGTHRVLADKVALATIDLDISASERGFVPAPEAKFQLMPTTSLLWFADGGGRQRVRPGAGLALMFWRRLSFEAQFLPARGPDPSGFLLSGDVGIYSDFLGGGRRRFLNPYVSLNLGAGRLGDLGVFSAGGGLGVELYRGPWLLVDLGGRAQVMAYSKEGAPADLALRLGLGVGVPF